MALIRAHFDTKDKTLALFMDDQEVANVKQCSMGMSYSDDEDYACQITTGEYDAENDIRKYTHMVASESKKGRELLDKGLAVESPLAGFVIDVGAGLGRDLSEHFKNNRKPRS